MDELSREQMEKVLVEIQDIAKILKEVNDILLTDHKKAPPPLDNIIFVVPHIAIDFQRVQGQTMKIPEIIGMYKKWTEDLCFAAACNKGHLKSKKLRAHLEQGYKICKSLEKILESAKK